MKKTLTVNLGGVIFNIEEDAYRRLDEYLNSIRDYFKSTDEAEDGDEIVSDIETRAAETFQGKKILNLSDVDSLVGSMGTVDDITGKKGEGASGSGIGKPQATKRLYRDTENSMVAGVCSGLAAYFGIDATIVRVLFVASLLFGGAGVIIYLILWIVVPEAKTTPEKIEMHGENVTLSKLKENVNKKIESVNRGKFQSAVRRFSTGIVNITKAVIPILLSVVGVLIMIAAALSIAAIVVSTVALIAGAGPLFFDIPFPGLFASSSVPVIAIAAAVAVIIPLTFLVSLGATLVKRKSAFTLLGFVGSFVIWIIALSVLAVGAVKTAPYANDILFTAGGDYVTRSYEIKDFSKISADHAFNIKVEKGAQFKVEATGPEDDLATVVSISKSGDTLVIKRGPEPFFCFFCWTGRTAVSVTVTMPELTLMSGTGATEFEVNGFIQNEMEVSLNGASRLKMNADINLLSLDLNGAARSTLVGRVETLKFTANGASRLVASDLDVTNAEINLDGASRAIINVNGSLNAVTNGASTLSYRGDPQVTQKTSGVSKIEHLQTATSTLVR